MRDDLGYCKCREDGPWDGCGGRTIRCGCCRRDPRGSQKMMLQHPPGLLHL